MKRINLFPGATATVSENIDPKTIEALTEMMRCVERMTMETQKAELETREFADTYKALSARVHPLVRFWWWLTGKYK